MRILVYMVVLFFYFRPATYVIGGSLYSYTSYLLIVFFIFELIDWWYSVSTKKIEFSKGIFLLLISYGWFLCGSTIINMLDDKPVNLSAGLSHYSVIGGLLVLSELGLSKCAKDYLKAFVSIGSIMCFLNAMTIFIYGNKGGMRLEAVDYGRHMSSNYFLLAEDNATLFWTFPVLVVLWFYYFRYNKSTMMWIWSVVYSIATIGSYIYMNSVTAMVATTLVALFIIMLYRSLTKNKNKFILKITMFKAVLIGYFISYILVFSNFVMFFKGIIVDVFQKDMTLSTRTIIWQKTIQRILESPLIGYGNEDIATSIYYLGINHTHNLLLEIMYRGGILGIILFTYALFVCGKKSIKSKGNPLYTFLCGSLMIFFSCLAIDFAFYRYPYVILLVMTVHEDIFKGTNQNQKSISAYRG